ncbi:MAG TPA: EAL domain-containing protein, partial [Burkholderiaceae bacterium]|nr:EAL domain-containing protein [Burkholderiaceae bacterium]
VGLAMRLPVYRVGMPQGSVEERRAAYLGSVGAGFRVAALMRDVVGNGSLRVRLFDGGAWQARTEVRADDRPVPMPAVADDKLLFDSKAKESSAAASAAAVNVASFERSLSFELGGRVWVVRVSACTNGVVGGFDRAVPWFIVACGIAISGLLAGILYSLMTSRGRAMTIAQVMTRHLRISERRLGEAQELASLGSWILDAESGTLQCSEEARRIFGFSVDDNEPTVRALMARIPAEQREGIEAAIARAKESHERVEIEHRLMLPDGRERWVHAIMQMTEEDGRLALRGTVRDDTQRQKGALRLKLEHDIARLLVGDGDTELVMARALAAICTQMNWDTGACWTVGADGLVRCGPAWQASAHSVLEQFMRVSGALTYRIDEGSLGRAWASGDLVCIDTSGSARDFTRDALARQAGLTSGVILPLSGGRQPTALEFFSRKPLALDAEMLESLRAMALQIAQFEQRKQAEAALRHLASHDALTGLSNRASLQQQLSRAIKRSNRHQKRLAVLFVDLDRFKHINDTLGHGAGDAIIQACGQRLGATLREGDTIVRFGGDEFVLVLEDLSEASDAAVVAGKVLACCAEPFIIDGRELHLTASVGVSVYPEDGSDGETLLKNADTAMYRAKDKGRGGYQYYAAQMNAQGTERLMLESGLRRAIERGELTLHYQPKMNLRTQQITGVEALMRWRHPVLGMVSPAQFIPIAEETGLIETMGRWALERACRDAQGWVQRGLPPLEMSVNLSVRQLNSATLLDDISDVLRSTGMDPELLELEITESAMMRSPDHAAALLTQIRELGVRLSIDDFGTGYSSLSYLKRFPLSTVKIDRSFVKDLSHDRDAQALAAGIVALAHGLRMKVVAEGVETGEQLAWLRSHDCDEIQGFLLCKPIAADDAHDFIARHLRTLFVSTAAA